MSIIKSKGKLWSTGTTEYYTILKMNGHNNIDECQEHNVTEEYKAAGNFIHIPVPGTHHNGP